MNCTGPKRRADRRQISGGRESMGDRIPSEQRLLVGRTEHQHAARGSESLAKRGCYNRTVTELLGKLGTRKPLALAAEQRYSMGIVDVEKQSIAVLQPAQLLNRRMASH